MHHTLYPLGEHIYEMFDSHQYNDVWFLTIFLIQSLIMYHFTTKTLSFSSDVFQINILVFDGMVTALTLG